MAKVFLGMKKSQNSMEKNFFLGINIGSFGNYVAKCSFEQS